MWLQSEWTALYEYLSILMHFRTLQIMFKKHPHIKQKIISESRDFFSLIQWLDIEQKSKEYWIWNYALFTSRIINFDEIWIKEIESILPEVYHAGKHDLYAINQALVQDNKRIDEWYSIT